MHINTPKVYISLLSNKKYIKSFIHPQRNFCQSNPNMNRGGQALEVLLGPTGHFSCLLMVPLNQDPEKMSWQWEAHKTHAIVMILQFSKSLFLSTFRDSEFWHKYLLKCWRIPLFQINWKEINSWWSCFIIWFLDKFCIFLLFSFENSSSLGEVRSQRYSILKLRISLSVPTIFLLPLNFSSTRLCPDHLCKHHLW